MYRQSIRDIKTLLNKGYIVKVKGGGCLWLNNKYIFWRHYGQSANKNTLKDLRWILKVIFEIDLNNIKYEIVDSTLA